MQIACKENVNNARTIIIVLDIDQKATIKQKQQLYILEIKLLEKLLNKTCINRDF
mgnify:CR=1 FL=1